MLLIFKRILSAKSDLLKSYTNPNSKIENGTSNQDIGINDRTYLKLTLDAVSFGELTISKFQRGWI